MFFVINHVFPFQAICAFELSGHKLFSILSQSALKFDFFQVTFIFPIPFLFLTQFPSVSLTIFQLPVSSSFLVRSIAVEFLFLFRFPFLFVSCQLPSTFPIPLTASAFVLLYLFQFVFVFPSLFLIHLVSL